jgi:hypothetical protein
MIKMTVVFENKISAPYNAEEFVKRHYLTDMAKSDIVKMVVTQQEDEIDA